MIAVVVKPFLLFFNLQFFLFINYQQLHLLSIMPPACMQKQTNLSDYQRNPPNNPFFQSFPSIMISSDFHSIENHSKNQKVYPKQEEHKQNTKIKLDLPTTKNNLFGPNFSMIPMCCRTYFFDLQRILPAENKKIQYKSYKYPFSPASVETLKKNICAFLNTIGGDIYIGVKQTTNKKYRYILSNYLTQNDKQEVVKIFRKIGQSIYPHCLDNLEIQFIPIRKNPFQEIDLKEQSETYYYDFSRKILDLRKCNYLPARYVIRIRVAAGKTDSIYSYSETEYQLNKNTTSNQFIPFRSQNQVLVKEISQQILKIFKSRLIYQKERLVQKVHPGPCKYPETGSPRNEPEPPQSMVDIKKIESSLNDNNEKTIKKIKVSNQKISNLNQRNQLVQVKKDLVTTISQSQLKYIFKHPLSYIVLNLTAQRLQRCINKTPAKDYALIQTFKNVLNQNSEILVISINKYHHMEQFLRIMKSLEAHFAKDHLEFIGISKCIKAEDAQLRKIIESRLQQREDHKHVIRKRVIEFYSLGVAASYLLYMRQLGFKVQTFQE